MTDVRPKSVNDQKIAGVYIVLKKIQNISIRTDQTNEGKRDLHVIPVTFGKAADMSNKAVQ